MLQLSGDKLQQLRNVVNDIQVFLVVDESTLPGMQYLNILVGSLETPHVSYLYDYQPLPCVPNSDSIAHAVGDAVTSFGTSRNCFSFCCLMLKNI